MKKLALTALASLLFALPAFAGQHTSSFGFSITLPDGWSAYGQQEIKSNPGLFDLSKPGFSTMDPNLVEQIKDKIQTGALEMYIHDGVGNESLTDNINAMQEADDVPASTAELKKLCDEMPGEFSKYFGHPDTFYQCDLTTVAGKNALLIEFDGALQGTRSIQYQIQSAPGTAIIFTGTFTNETLEQERGVFLGIVRSMHFR